MTKRFWIFSTLTKCSGIKDKDKLLTFDEVVDLLNALNEENEQLKSICQDHRDHAIDFKADCVRLEKENEQLKEELKYYKAMVHTDISKR